MGGKLPHALQYSFVGAKAGSRLCTRAEAGIRVKDVERLKEEGNAAFKAGRLNEADGSPGRKYGR